MFRIKIIQKGGGKPEVELILKIINYMIKKDKLEHSTGFFFTGPRYYFKKDDTKLNEILEKIFNFEKTINPNDYTKALEYNEFGDYNKLIRWSINNKQYFIPTDKELNDLEKNLETYEIDNLNKIIKILKNYDNLNKLFETTYHEKNLNKKLLETTHHEQNLNKKLLETKYHEQSLNDFTRLKNTDYFERESKSLKMKYIIIEPKGIISREVVPVLRWNKNTEENYVFSIRKFQKKKVIIDTMLLFIVSRWVILGNILDLFYILL